MHAWECPFWCGFCCESYQRYPCISFLWLLSFPGTVSWFGLCVLLVCVLLHCVFPPYSFLLCLLLPCAFLFCAVGLCASRPFSRFFLRSPFQTVLDHVRYRTNSITYLGPISFLAETSTKRLGFISFLFPLPDMMSIFRLVLLVSFVCFADLESW